MLVDPVVARNVSDDVRAELGDVRLEIFTPELEAEVRAKEPVRFPDHLRCKAAGRDMAILIYTSGTTGWPKAAIVSWIKLITAGAFSAKRLGTKSTDVFYTVAAQVDAFYPCARTFRTVYADVLPRSRLCHSTTLPPS
jgi:acyl-CoA synthetase (AMP-forming)/AMP-acid ligase II